MCIVEILFFFEGRIKRSTFWATIIPVFIVATGLTVGMLLSPESGAILGVSVLGVWATWIFIAIYIKRFHDLDWSAWWTLTLFIPAINILILLFLGLAPGTAGPNRYGARGL